MFPQSTDAYCGPAPVPADILLRWNPDPLAIALMAAVGALWFLHGRRDGAGRGALFAALLAIALLFLSPLCALTTALFSARSFHHVALIAIAAPALAAALPWRNGPAAPLTALTAGNAVILWIWHVPGIYEWGISSTVPYWTMQISLLLPAWLFWRSILAARGNHGAILIALAGFTAQMGLLGALLVFAPHALYAPHLATTAPFGLTALADQQLAGLLMWVPAMLPYLAAGAWLLTRMLGTLTGDERRGPAP